MSASPDVLDSNDLVLLILGAPSASPELQDRCNGITRLEKLAFLLEHQTDFAEAVQTPTEDLDFRAYHYGPYSQALYDAVGLLASIGLVTDRRERRLTETGAPAMRYYLPGLRFFLGVPEAQQATNELIAALGDDHRCPCSICREHDWNLLELNNDELKAHFLTMRAAELRDAQADITGQVAAVEALGAQLTSRFAPAPDEDEDAISKTEKVLAARGGVLSAWASFLRSHLP
jgi:hypothetical protein